MISSVRGTVLGVAGTRVVVEVGGVGLEIAVTPAHALGLHIGSEATLRTALIVREDDLALYGFADAEERAVFDLLRGVTGVGPKSAMGVLAAMAPDDIARAVAAEDDGAFRKVSGIGPKTAKLIVVSLAGKMQAVAASAGPSRSGRPSVGESVLVALIGLGWSERVAAEAVDEALAAHRSDGATGKGASASSSGADQTITVAALLRLALGRLGSGSLSGSGSR